MPRTVTVTLQDGTQHVYQNAPDDITPDAVEARAQKDSGQPVAHLDGGNVQPMGWGDVAEGAAKNLLPSAAHLAGGIYSAVRHPVDTLSSIGTVASGVPEALARGANAAFGIQDNTPVSQNEQAADAVGQYYKNRYGSIGGFKNALATDPVGVAADAAAVAPIGEISPIRAMTGAVGKTAPLAGRALAEGLGVTTGAGADSLRTAYNAGRTGGDAAQALADNMRGNVPTENIVDTARQGLGNIRATRSQQYRAGMGAVNADPTALSMDPINAAVANTANVKNFNGIDLAPSTGKVRQQIADALMEWETNPDPAFRTAAGFDALKQRIGDIRDTTDYGSPDRLVANNAYNAVKNEVMNQAPTYAGVMGNYADASDKLNELEKTFSLGEGKLTDTAVRKLQSSLRNNVNTGYGRRLALAQELQGAGAPNLMESLAGQTLAPTMPRGLGRAIAGGELGGGITTAALGHPAAAAALIPALALQSPRLVGEGALAAGRGAQLANALKLRHALDSRAALVAAMLGEHNGGQ